MSFSNKVAAGSEDFPIDVCEGHVSSNPSHLPFREAFARWLHRDPWEGAKGDEVKYFYHDDFCRINIQDGTLLIMWRPLHSVISNGIAHHHGWGSAVLGIQQDPLIEIMRLRLAVERADILRAFTDVGATIRKKTCSEHDYVDIEKVLLWSRFPVQGSRWVSEPMIFAYDL